VQKTYRLIIVALFGSIIGLLRPSLIPFSIIYSILYGVLVDVFMKVFKVKASTQGVNRNKLIYAMACSTLLIGFLSYYSTTLFPQIIAASPMVDMMVAFFGPATGAVAGYAAAYLWNKYLKSISL